jgi:mxaK protein
MKTRLRALALYNLANERTRQGVEFVRKGDLDHAAALINVAKTEYRLALKIDPRDWNTKYNLDIAMRIVRDLPQADNLSDEELQTPKKIWTDLPGVPKGLP